MVVMHKHSRIGHRILLKLRMRESGSNKKFGEAHKLYIHLITYVNELHESLTSYALQLARQTEAARVVGDCAAHLYGRKNIGFKSAIAFKDAQEQAHSGYAGQIQQAFVKGVIEPVAEWQKELEALEAVVTHFNGIQVQHDHYRLKVQDLATKAQALEERAFTHGDGKDARAAAEKLKRNTAKLEEVTKEYEKVLKNATDALGRAWDDRFRMMNNIIGRIISFQETFFSQQLMNGLGVSRIFADEDSDRKRMGSATSIDSFVPTGNVRHFEGALTRKYKVTRVRMWFRLVGGSLEVYSMKNKDDPSHVVTETPKAIYEVKGVVKTSETYLTVMVRTDDAGLILIAADAADGQAWFDALERASVWDANSSAKKVESHVRNSQQFLAACKAAHTKATTREGVERSLGVTQALANSPTPPSDLLSSTGGGVSQAGGGGGGQVASKSAKGGAGAGGKAAAGVAAGGEAGVGGWGTVPWGYQSSSSHVEEKSNGVAAGSAAAAAGAAAVGAAAVHAVAHGGGKKTKKKGGRWSRSVDAEEEKAESKVASNGTASEEKMPDLVDADGNRAGGVAAGAAAAAAGGMAAAGMAAGNRMNLPGGMPPGMPNGMMHGGPGRGPMGMMGGPGHPPMGGPMMQQSPMMMQRNPPPVMMGPNGPVTLMQPGMRGSMRGGPPVMMGPNGPVTLMGSGPPMQGGGQWPGSQFGGRGPWGPGMANRSFATRFGPQRARPGILQRTRSLGMENVDGPYGFTRDEVMYPNVPGAQPAFHSYHGSSGPGAAAFGVTGAPLGTAGAVAAGAAAAAAAAAAPSANGTPAAAPAAESPAAATSYSSAGIDSPAPARASAADIPGPVVDVPVSAAETAAPMDTPVPMVTRSAAPSDVPTRAADISAPATDSSPVAADTSASAVAATAAAAAAGAAAAVTRAPAPSSSRGAVTTSPVLSLDDADSDPSPLDKKRSVPSDLSIDPTARATFESAQTSRVTGSSEIGGSFPLSGSGSSERVALAARQRKTYRGWRKMMSLGSIPTDSGSGGDAREQSEAGSRYRVGSPTGKTRKGIFPVDDEEGGADASSDKKASSGGVENSRSFFDVVGSGSGAGDAADSGSKSYPSPVGGEPKRSLTFGEERKLTPTKSSIPLTSTAGSALPGPPAKPGKPIKAGSSVAATAAGFLAAAKNRTSRNKTSEVGEGAAPSSGDLKRPVVQREGSNASTEVEGFVPLTEAKGPSVKERIASMNKKLSGAGGGDGDAGGDVGAGVNAPAADKHGGGASFDLIVDAVGVDGIDISGVGNRGTDTSVGDADAAVGGSEGSSGGIAVPNVDTDSPFVTSNETRRQDFINSPVGGVVAPAADSEMPGLVDSTDQAFIATTRSATSSAPTVSTSSTMFAPAIPAAGTAVAAAASSSLDGEGAAGGGAVVPVSSTTMTTTAGDYNEGASARSNGSGNVSSAESSGSDPSAAQAKVFHRLCASQGGKAHAGEAETGDAGGGAEEPALSFSQLMGWDEVQELIEYGALKEGEVKTLWDEALRSQDERTIASTAKAHGDIWGAEETKEEKKELLGQQREPSTALTLRGFMILVKLIEELQFERELEQERGVGLVPGPVCVV